MTLVQSWIDSLQLLKPKNFKLFAMVTLKSIIEAYKLLFKYFWWLLALNISLLGYSLSIITARDGINFALYAQLQGVAYLLFTFLFMAVCFATRPSIAKKDCAYFRGQYRRILPYWFLWLLLFTVSSVKQFGMALFYINIYSVTYIFSLLFFADSSGNFRSFVLSIVRAFKMIIFNVPILLVIGLSFYGCKLLFYYAATYIIVYFVTEESLMANIFIGVRVLGTMLSVLLLPIGICTYANIYIKKLHDQFDLYIKQPQ